MDDTRTQAALDALRRGIQKAGLSRATASAIANRHRAPSLQNAAQIETVLGIPMRSWVDGDPVAEMWRIMASDEA